MPCRAQRLTQLCVTMSCNFDSIDEFTALDRLRLPMPKNLPPVWRLHVVQLRPGYGGGDRVYDFYGASTGTAWLTAGCFALCPEDAMQVAHDTAKWCHDAWPVLRPVPGPHHWISVSPAINQFVDKLGVFRLDDIRMLPWSSEAWYLRFDDGPHVVRHFAWFARDESLPPAWQVVQRACHQLAARRLRATPSRGA